MRDKRRGRKNPSDLQMRQRKAHHKRSRKSQKLAQRAKQILSEITKGEEMEYKGTKLGLGRIMEIRLSDAQVGGEK